MFNFSLIDIVWIPIIGMLVAAAIIGGRKRDNDRLVEEEERALMEEELDAFVLKDLVAEEAKVAIDERSSLKAVKEDPIPKPTQQFAADTLAVDQAEELRTNNVPDAELESVVDVQASQAPAVKKLLELASAYRKANVQKYASIYAEKVMNHELARTDDIVAAKKLQCS